MFDITIDIIEKTKIRKITKDDYFRLINSIEVSYLMGGDSSLFSYYSFESLNDLIDLLKKFKEAVKNIGLKHEDEYNFRDLITHFLIHIYIFNKGLNNMTLNELEFLCDEILKNKQAIHKSDPLFNKLYNQKEKINENL